MKQFFLTAIAVFTLTFVTAQEETQEFGFSRSDVFIEGNLGFSSSKNTSSDVTGDLNETKNNSFTFNPKAGYFLTDKFAIGVELSIGNSKTEANSFGNPNFISETKGSLFGAGVFARYYFLELGKRFKTYTQLGVGYVSSKSEASQTGSTQLTNDVETSDIGTRLGLGLQYFVTPRIAINFGLSDILSFSSGTSKDNITNVENKFSSFGGNLNVFNNFFNTATLGLTYKL